MSEELAKATAAATAEAAPQTCDRCDRESRYLTRWLAPGGGVEYLCWSCQQRREKRVNVNQRWKRERRG
jgi:hypothetical protein